MPLAYFITFSTYGTWLPGSAKGKGSVDRHHNQYATEFAQPNPARELQATSTMAQPPYVMDAPQREIVKDAIVSLANEKQWPLLAAHVRSNHVHAVISADRDPARLMSDLKSRASRDLTRAGFDDANRRRWTRHGSTLHLFTPQQVQLKIHYTLHQQGPPMSTYPPANESPHIPPPKEPRTQ